MNSCNSCKFKRSKFGSAVSEPLPQTLIRYSSVVVMGEKRVGVGDTKPTLVNNNTGQVIPPPATQQRYWRRGPDSRKRRTRFAILFLVVLFFFWVKSHFPCATHVQDGKYSALMREYMKHGNRKPNDPLRGSKAEELFL